MEHFYVLRIYAFAQAGPARCLHLSHSVGSDGTYGPWQRVHVAVVARPAGNEWRKVPWLTWLPRDREMM